MTDVKWVVIIVLLIIAFIAGLVVGYAAGEEDWFWFEQRKRRGKHDRRVEKRRD